MDGRCPKCGLFVCAHYAHIPASPKAEEYVSVYETLGDKLDKQEVQIAQLVSRTLTAEAKLKEREKELEDNLTAFASMNGMIIRLIDEKDRQATTIERLTGYKTAFDTAREQILYMVGPLEINEILTTMDEACEQAAPSKQEPK